MATGDIKVGDGTGTVGTASGAATSGAFSQSGGTVLAGGNVTIWIGSGAFQQDAASLRPAARSA